MASKQSSRKSSSPKSMKGEAPEGSDGSGGDDWMRIDDPAQMASGLTVD